MLRVLTFNVRYGEAADGLNDWSHRRRFALDTIRGHDPDLVGLQEPNPGQCAEVTAALQDGWEGLHGIRLDPRSPEAYAKGLWYRRTRFDLDAHGVFWISETPDEPGSILQPNQWGERTGGWARLRDRRDGRSLCFVCTHFDTHPGCSLRSAEIFAREIERVARGLPVIAVGDYNNPAGTPAYQHLAGPAGYRDAWVEAGHTEDGIITFNGFDPRPRQPADPTALRSYLETKHGPDGFGPHHVEEYGRLRNERLDWVLLKGGLRCTDANTDTTLRDGRVASDHFAVVADLEWSGR